MSKGKRVNGKGKKGKKEFNFILYTLLLTLLLSLSGCWNLVEIDKRAFITALGIDRNQRGGAGVTIQIPMPMRMLPPSVNGGAQSGKRFTVTSFDDETVNAALNDLQSKTFYELVIEQNKAIVIGEQAARAGLKPLIEYLIRDPKSPPQALIFIAHNHSAREILSATPIQEVLPGLQFFQSSHLVIKYDRTYFIPVWDFLRRVVHQPTDTFAPLLDYDPGEKRFIAAGLGVFNGYRLAGKLDGRETQYFGLLAGLMRSGNLTLNLPDSRKISLQSVRGKSRIKAVKNQAGMPAFRINIEVTGGISEIITGQKKYPKDLSPAYVRQVESEIQRVLTRQIIPVVRKLQRYNSDVIDFGEQLRVQRPELWKRLNWKRVFPKVSFKLAVKVKITRDGVFQ